MLHPVFGTRNTGTRIRRKEKCNGMELDRKMGNGGDAIANFGICEGELE